MFWSAGELGIEIDFGSDKPGAVLQRKEKGHWHDYLVDGKPVVNPFDVEALPPGFCRLREEDEEDTHRNRGQEEDRKKTPTGRKNKKGLLKTVPGFHPAGALRATKFVPDKFVKPTVAMRQWLRSPLLCQIKNPAEAGLCLFGGACSLLRTRLRQDFPVL